MTQAWVTLATNDAYGLGCLVLGKSLRRVGTSRRLHVMVTPGVTQQMRSYLGAVFDTVEQVDLMDSGDSENLNLMARPDLGVTFTKLHCWRLTQYEKCVFVDADCLVVQNSDELFEHDEFSAAPDIGWPDCFNSGVFVFVPSHDTWKEIIDIAYRRGSFDGGDQGVLNEYFSNWRELDARHRLSFVYNMSSSVAYTYTPAHKRFAERVKIVHFLGALKPWHHVSDKGRYHYRGESTHSRGHVDHWWTVYQQDVAPLLREQFTEVAARATAGVGGHAHQAPLTDDERQKAWEEGHIDFTGEDSWHNIQKKLDQHMPKK